MKLFSIIAAAMAILGSMGTASAVNTVVLDDAVLDGEYLGLYSEIAEDRESGLAIEDIAKGDAGTLAWKQAADKAPGFGYTDSAYWVRFTVINPHPAEMNWYLEVSYPLINDIDLYIQGPDGAFSVKRQGTRYPFDRRDIRHRNFVFSLHEKPGGSRTYYIRFKTDSSMNIPLRAWSPENFIASLGNELPVFWILIGILFTLIIYNLFLFFFTRDRNSLYYMMSVSSGMLFVLSFYGLAFQHLWPESLWWTNRSVLVGIFSTSFSILLFSRSFLKLSEMKPTMGRVLLVIAVINMIGLIASLVAPYSYMIRIALVMCLFYVLPLISAIMLMTKGLRVAYFYTLSWAVYLAGVPLIVLKSFGILPDTFLTNWLFLIGAAWQAILLAIGLTDKINTMSTSLQELNRDLEIRVQDRTRELTEANDKLLEMDKIKSNFFANISHEIRTPLTLILSPVESAIQGDRDILVDDTFLLNIHRNAIRLLKLINNLLDFSKIEAGQMVLNVKELDVIRLIRVFVDSVLSSAESKSVSLEYHPEREEINLFLDLEKFDRIILNLFSNALKFTDTGGAIAVRICASDGLCRIEISDSGIGIPADKIDRIFDRFSQADMTSTRSYEGTGIGLALAKEFVEMHGGSITVASKYIGDHPDDHGSLFTVSLPTGKKHLEGRSDVVFVTEGQLEESVSDHASVMAGFISRLERPRTFGRPADRAGKDAHGFPGDESRKRILIVEDNPDMRDFLVVLLDKDYDIHLAFNGEEGLRKTRDLRPDLVLSDVMMPIMNGYDMTREIKNDRELDHIPVILLTAKADMAYKIEGLEQGADDYLTKPFNSKELLARIRTLLNNHEYQKLIRIRNLEMERDLEVARKLQQKLLPESNPVIPGYELYSCYIPMDKVGGDFYDYRLRDDCFDIFIADVSGHGLPGAFLATLTKLTLDNISDRSSPSRVQAILNDIIIRSVVNNAFVTTFFCTIDMKNNVLRFTNAGHCPPIIYRKRSGEYIELHSAGNPLGWQTNLKLEEKEFQLERGDRIIFYTDGITECRIGDRMFFGEEKLIDFIRENAVRTPKEFSDNLMDSLRSFRQSDSFDDDITFVVLDVK
ncbi:MAG: SpoIIE family protein phosphatase [Spirochaetes bacterium]|nr:SpoIIE family protein phosphatase [Spirochaetota bacterium]